MAGNKSGETILGLLGTALDMGGKVLLGPDAGNIDLGAPFKLGANLARESREQKALLEVLQGNPHTAPLVEIGKGALENGGLLNGILPGEQGGMPQQTGMTDINSAMFPILLAKQGGNPELVNNLILAQAQKKAVDPLDRIKDLLGIEQMQRDLNTPQLSDEEKIRLTAELSAEAQNRKLDNQLTLEKQKNVERLVKEGLDDFGKIQTSYTTSKQLLQRIDNGQWPSTAIAAATSIPGGKFVVQRAFPEAQEVLDQINTIQEQNRNIAAEVKAFTGAQATDAERKFLISTTVGKWDTPEAARTTLSQATNRQLYGMYLIAYNRAIAAGDKESGLEVFKRYGFTPEQAQAFHKYRKIFNSGKDPMKTKEGLSLINELGFLPPQ